mmetsp:Transcript_42312/g.108918  ORF Transcript_42312/g.108918 Transcript_42312/m.108918 type:complete len:135 (+) Transcript_42312:245-649(+)
MAEVEATSMENWDVVHFHLLSRNMGKQAVDVIDAFQSSFADSSHLIGFDSPFTFARQVKISEDAAAVILRNRDQHRNDKSGMSMKVEGNRLHYITKLGEGGPSTVYCMQGKLEDGASRRKGVQVASQQCTGAVV